MADTELSDFNWHFLSQYGRIKFYVAGRFWDAMKFDKAPIDPYRLACEFYARYGFSVNPTDFYTDENRIRYPAVDALVKENPSQLSDVGQMLYASWLGFKKNLEAQRAEEPKLPTIPPPPPEPPKELPKDDPWSAHPRMPLPPKPKEKEEHKQEPKQEPKQAEPKKKLTPPIWLAKFSVYFGLASGLAWLVGWFVPVAKPWIFGITEFVKLILSSWGL